MKIINGVISINEINENNGEIIEINIRNNESGNIENNAY
jgi:hypothetical protein